MVDEWSAGIGWQVHEELARRTSYAVAGPAPDGDRDRGLWLLDPLDGPGLDDALAGAAQELGAVDPSDPVVGVLVCSDYHVRDAPTLARRYDVPLVVPAGLDRAASRVDEDLDLRRARSSDANVQLRPLGPLGLWREVALWRSGDATLYVPDVVTTADTYTLGGERATLNTLARLRPPREQLGDCAPDHLPAGHGAGLHDDASAVLDGALASARRPLPAALVANGVDDLRGLVAALE